MAKSSSRCVKGLRGSRPKLLGAVLEHLESRQLLSSGPLLISEFVAKNTAIADNFAQFSDWIEIHNPTQTSLSLDGWYLTDNANNKTKWRFPDTTGGADVPLAAGGYLVVWASGTSRVVPGQPLHTSFALSQSPGYLGLVQPDGVTVASEYAPVYPAQVSDVSYGWTTDGTRQGYFFEPSMGFPNGNDVSGSSAPVIINEIMYNTARGKAGGIGYQPESPEQEYIELYNRGKTTVSLAGWQVNNWWFSPNPLKLINGISSANGLVATASFSAAHGYANGDSVLITGASPAQFNGVFTISNVTATSFDYAISGVAAAATGVMTSQVGVRAVSGITREDYLATVTLPAHGFVNGDTILLSGADQDAYNGVFTILNVTTNTFSCLLSDLPASPATGRLVAEKVTDRLPEVGVASQGYLALAADARAFREKYPTVTNVIGGWTPKLANNGETITLRDELGDTVDRVEYSNEGDWGQRTRGEQLVTGISVNGTTVTLTVPYHGYTIADRAEDKIYRVAGVDQAVYNGEFTITAVTRDTITYSLASAPGSSPTGSRILIQKKDAGHYGWEWYSAADGGGKSLELINSSMGNNNGQNWTPSTVAGGTPGAVNSVAAADIAPLISDVTHFPIIPRSTDPVYVTASIADEKPTGITASVYYRLDGAASFTVVAMADDGLHGDGIAGDGLWGGTVPPQANNAIIEFYVSVSDAGAHTRVWPAAPGLDGVAPAALYSGQTSNLLYQVDNTYDPSAAWTPGSQPFYRLIMKETDRAELAYIGSHDPDRWSDAAMSGTFISVSGSGIDLVYQANLRDRGHGTRLGTSGANNYKIEIPHDRPWKGQTETIINFRNTPSQVLGASLFQAADLATPLQQPIQVRVNGVNYALTTSSMYGSYASKEQYNSDFTARAFPDDPNGNLYIIHYVDYPYTTNTGAGGELEYRGTSADAYRNNYFKQTNVSQDDWSDLINLTYVLDVANPAGISDANFVAEASKVIDITQWLRYIAVDAILGNREGGLYSGQGDDYGMYRGVNDTRFQLVQWDSDTLMVYNGGSNPYTQGILTGYSSVAGLSRLLSHPYTVGLYYQQLQQLCDTVFSPASFDPMVDQTLGGWAAASQIAAIKTWMVNRVANVRSQLPSTAFTIASGLATQGGYPHTTSTSTSLSGTADQVNTRSVMVNGQLAQWNSATGAWSFGTAGSGGSGVSDFLTNTGTDWKYWAATGFNVTGYQATIPVTDVPTAESVISNAANRSGTWTGLVPAINHLNAVTYTFQQGVNGYTGAVDTYVGSDSASTSHATATTLNVDTVDSAGPAHALLRFDNIFGTTAGKIPLGSTIANATLTINVTNASAQAMTLNRMLGTWADSVTWAGNFGGNGIQANGTEALASADASLQPGSTGTYVINVTSSLQAWSSGTANYGWAFLPGGTDGIDFASSENATLASRPLLTVSLAGSTDGHFTANNAAFPGQTASVDDFVMQATYRLYVPTAGDWTFGVTSDDGFKLTLDNGVEPTRTSEFDGIRSMGDTLTTFNFAQAGTYDLRLVYFDRTGNAGVELYAAPGTWATYAATNTWRLVGDVAHGGLGDSDQGTAWRNPAFNDSSWLHGPSELGYGDNNEPTPVTYVDADPTTAAVEKNFTTYFRRSFEVTDVSQYNGLIAHLMYDDGAIVYLNGTEVMRTSNMTGTVTATTAANPDTPGETTFYDFPISLSALQVGTNVLAVEIHQGAAIGSTGSTSADISMDLRLEATRPGGSSGTGLNLVPGINRIPVQTFDGPNGTGNRLQDTFIDIWCDPATTPATPPPALADPAGLEADPHLNLVARSSYLSGVPITVRVEIADAQQRVDRDVWNATATLSVDNPNVTLSATQVTLYSGMGSVMVVPTWNGTGSGDFTLTASWTDATRGLTRTVQKALVNWAAQPQTNVSGTLSGNTTWSGIVHMTGSVTVPTGSTLTIQPGTLVLIDGVTSGTAGFGLVVQGSVQSLGTAASPVTFTTPTYASALAWGEIRHTSAAASLYQYTEILRTGRAPGQGHTNTGPSFNVSASTITFDHSSISDNVGKIMQASSGSLNFQHSLLARAVMGPEITGTALLMQDSFILSMHNNDDADGIYLHNAGAQSLVLRGGVVADVFDDCVDTLNSAVVLDDMVLRSNNDKGLSVFNGSVTLTRSLFAENGLAAEDGTSVAISGKCDSGVTATINLDRVTVYSETIAIQARRKTNGVTGETITYNVTNSILRAPQPLDISSAAGVSGLPTGNFNISYSDTFGDLTGYTIVGANNLNTDPLLVNPAAHDYRLLPASPAIDAGNPAGLPDTDGSSADMGYRPFGVGTNVLAPQTIAAGTITQNTLMYAAGGPYHVTGDVILDAGATLTILPGTQVFFDAGASLTINGRLLAEGTATQMIRLTAYPGAGYWDGLHFQNTTQDNRLTYAIVEYGEGLYGVGNDRAMIAVTDSTLLLDHDYFDHARYRRIRTVGSSLTISNSTFTDIFGPSEAPLTNNASEQIWGNTTPQGGQFLLLNNIFGTSKGHNDIIDVDGGLVANGDPMLQIIGNVFMGGGDDALDIEGDALIQGNIFRNFHKDSYAYTQDPAGEANTISAGDTALVGHQYNVIGNVFYEVDHAILCKDKSTLSFLNNTVINVTATKPAIYFDVINDSAGAGLSATIRDSIFVNVPIVVDLTVRAGAPAPVVSITNSLLPASWHAYGTGNSAESPRLAADFTLLPGSPALRTGPFGLDKGGMVPLGATIAGAPTALTAATSATLSIGGLGVAAYKYRLNSSAWSAETPVATPLQLTGLANGTYTVEVLGRNIAGTWQSEDAASITWTVDTSPRRIRLTEVLALNTSLMHNGATPDMIELRNDGSAQVDLGGMGLSDDPANPARFVFPAGTLLDPGAVLVVYADDDTASPGLHLGFALESSSGGVYLYDTVANGLTLLDSVVYGPQVANFSIGRVGHDGAWALTQPTLGTANVAARTGNPSTLKLNEWLTTQVVRLTDDFIELYNPDPLPVSLTGLYLTDRPGPQPAKHQIAPLSFVGGAGFVALKADGQTDKGADHLNFKLSADIEEIALYDASLQPLDRVFHFDQTTDVSQGRSPDGGPRPYQYFTIPTPDVANAAIASLVNVAGGLRITELMYNPAVDNALEFIELQNTGATTLDLTGVRLTGGGLDFAFPAMTLGAGKYVVVVRNLQAFTEHYGPGINVAGEYDGNLNDTGEGIVLQLPAPYDSAVLRFGYESLWYPSTDGGGYSLTIRDPAALAASWDEGASWQAGTVVGGSPGRADAATLTPQVVINEVLTHTTNEPLRDAIELYNPTGSPINIGGWYLSDSGSELRKFQIPANTTIPAGGYVVFYEGHWVDHVLTFDQATEFGGTGPLDFALNAYLGDQVWLSAADGTGNVTEVIDVVQFGAVADGESLGRWSNGAGNLYPMVQRTLDTPLNANDSGGNGPRIGPVVFNEVMYRPAGNLSASEIAAGFSDIEDLEFVEILNPTSTTIDLAHWQLSGGISFAFAGGTLLAPGGALAIVPFDPANTAMLAAFQARYGAAGAIAVVGPYSGHLSNLGEKIQLQRPDLPPAEAPTLYPALLEDEVVFSPAWGANADGLSLHRLAPNTWGNAAASWMTATPTLPAPTTSPDLIITGDGNAANLDDVVRIVRNGSMLDVYINSAVPTLSRDFATLQSLIFNGLSGADRLILDASLGEVVPWGGISFAGGAGTDTLEVHGASSAQAFTLTAGQVSTGGLGIGYTGVEALDLNAGTYTAIADLFGVSVTARAPLALNSTQHLAGLHVTSGTSVQVAPGGANLLRLSQLTIDGPNGTLDLADNDLILDSADPQAALNSVRQWIASARNASPLWTGPGLTSSIAGGITGLAAIVNNDGTGNPVTGSFGPPSAPEPVNINCVLVKYTYNGDQDLNGVVDADDYFAIDAGFLAHPSVTYARGDFDYNGLIDIDDYFLIDVAHARQNGALAARPAPTPLPVAAAITPASSPFSDVPIGSEDEAFEFDADPAGVL